MASYTPNVPVSGQSLGQSRPIINANFQLIQQVFDENHVDFNATNAGFHTYVDLQNQSANSNPPAGVISHYSKLVNGNAEWFLQRENSGSVIQMSNLAGNPSVGSSGRTFLPGGLILQWGTFTTSNVESTVTFSTPFPAHCFAVTLGAVLLSNTAIVDVRLTAQPGLSTFKAQVNTGIGSINCFYIAIGN